MCRLFNSKTFRLLWTALLLAPFGHTQSESVLIGIIGDQYLANAGTDPYPALTQAVALLKDQKVRGILHVGDLIEAKGIQSEGDYKLKFDVAAQILDQGQVPWFITPGDHDVVPDLDMNDWTREVTDHSREGYFLKLYAARKPQLNPKSLFYSFNLEGYHFVALYSIENLRADVRWGDVFRVEVSDDQLRWLEDDLATHAQSKGTIVFTHQPLWYNPAAWQRVQRVLQGHNVLAVIAGHFHYTQDEGTTDGIRYLVVGASGATVGPTGQDRSPESGGQPIAILMKLLPHKVEFEQKGVPSGKTLPILSRHDQDRVQAFSQGLGEIYGDIGQHTRLCLDEDGQLANPRPKAASSTTTGSPLLKPATLGLCAIGNPVDVPAEVRIELLSDKVAFDRPTFDPTFCTASTPDSCTLSPGRRAAVSNPSSVSFVQCKQYDYGTNSEDQGIPEIFYAAIRPSQADYPKVNDTIPLRVTYRFRGDSANLWVNQTLNLQVDACAPQGPPAIPSGPLGDVDQLFVSSYTSSQSNTVETGPPFVVVAGSSLILHRKAQKETVRVIPDTYHALKDVAHVPFTIYLQLSPLTKTGDTLTDVQVAALRRLSTKIDAAQHSLTSGGYTPEEIPRQQQILNESQTIVSNTLDRKRVDAATLAAFARRMGPLMLLNARDAACLQVQGTHAQMMKWKGILSSSEWNSLMVVNRARHQARYRNAATQYFHWLLTDKGSSWSYPGESMRVIYAESLGPNEDASDEFATVLIDEGASAAFFDDPWRLSEDILSNGAEECIRKLPDTDRLHP